jgi:hypothetical protein
MELILKCVYYLLVFCRFINHVKNKQNVRVVTPKKTLVKKVKR